MIKLPKPRLDGSLPLEKAIGNRRSARSFGRETPGLDTASLLLWAAQGITGPNGLRAAPSAGATYPLEVYLLAGRVDGLGSGVYRYLPDIHSLSLVLEGDARHELGTATLGQQWLEEAPFSLILTAVLRRTTVRYGEQGTRYVYMEAGHAAQNVYLQAEAVDMNTVAIGAFSDNDVADLLQLEEGEVPLYILPAGFKY